DVVVIAAGFMLRLLAGTAGIGIEPSNWLLACGFLLTLFLGFAKRRAAIGRGHGRGVRLVHACRGYRAAPWHREPDTDRALGAARHPALSVPAALSRRRGRSGRGAAARSLARGGGRSGGGGR